MSIIKKPVTSSIGIEIKLPNDISVEGDPIVAPKVQEQIIKKIYKIKINLNDGSYYYKSFETKDELIEYMSIICQKGFLKLIDKKNRKYKYYPPTFILPSEVYFEE